MSLAKLTEARADSEARARCNVTNWYDNWRYENVSIPASYVNRAYHDKRDLGAMHIYYDPASSGIDDTYLNKSNGFDMKLWMYAGVLWRQNDISKLLDIARRGDALARGRALILLANLFENTEHANEYKRILSGWLTAYDYTDTVDVSEVVIWKESEFQYVKMCAMQARRIIQDVQHNTSKYTDPQPKDKGLFNSIKFIRKDELDNRVTSNEVTTQDANQSTKRPDIKPPKQNTGQGVKRPVMKLPKSKKGQTKRPKMPKRHNG